MRDGGRVNKDGDQRTRENWVDSRNISEVDWSGIRDWLDVGVR